MQGTTRWVLLLPVFLFIVASWLFVHSESEARVLFLRAKEQWRAGNFRDAVDQFEALYHKYPESNPALSALWEVATIYYFNLYDIGNALYSFERLIARSPNGEYTAEAHLKLAEIFEYELNEISKAIDHWNRALKLDISDDLRRQVCFRLADALFKTGQLEEAQYYLALIVADGQDRHMSQQAQIRLGSIFQIRKDYRRSIEMFRDILDEASCPNCRLQAQLGLIESYEYLDRLPEAIAVAQGISDDTYPASMRNELLERLTEKRKYYEPRLWSHR